MSKDYFKELPPELILLLSTSLSAASLNALVLTCHRLRQILQPELESRITPQLAYGDEGYRDTPLHLVTEALKPGTHRKHMMRRLKNYI
ncbi:hypothetical protein B0H19DRAFT_1370265 [Mycena capillaripes]|nr:hypothetical protein B0H19DRAFT_1370265 [Mycena capillaripes]